MPEAIFDELLKIKSFREQSAANEVLRQTHAVEECARAVDEAKQEVVRYHGYRIRHERELFDEISGRQVALKDLAEMRATVAGMVAEEARKRDCIGQEQKRLEAAKSALEEARRLHMEAVREEEKFKQLLEAQRNDEALQLMRAEDKEIEEIVSAGWKPGNEEDGGE